MMRTLRRKVLPSLGAAVVLLLGFCLARAAFYGSPRSTSETLPDIALPEGAAERLAGAKGGKPGQRCRHGAASERRPGAEHPQR